MIQVAANRILINNAGSSPFLFDIDSLHDRLNESFNACGIKNSWMADDILIAVHSCMDTDDKAPITEEYLDQLHARLIKVLQDNGFPEVATHFSRSLVNNSTGELIKKIDRELNQLGIPVQQQTLDAVLNKILSLGYPPEQISPLLIREFCRLELHSPSPLPQDEDFNQLDFMPFEQKYVNWDWNFLSMKAAGHLFNSIRVDLYPVKLANSMQMKTFMELLFMNEWQQLLTKASSYLQSCLHHFAEISGNKIDYISVVTHDLEQMVITSDLGENPPLIKDLNQSVTVAFGDVLKQFSQVNFRER
jgi:hypothetical protein